jgi:hypothetical protein
VSEKKVSLAAERAHAQPHSLPVGKTGARSACIDFDINRKFIGQNRHAWVGRQATRVPDAQGMRETPRVRMNIRQRSTGLSRG